MCELGGTPVAVIFDQVVIIGVGLIGGSLGMAIRKHNLANQVIGIDLDAQSLALAAVKCQDVS